MLPKPPRTECSKQFYEGYSLYIFPLGRSIATFLLQGTFDSKIFGATLLKFASKASFLKKKQVFLEKIIQKVIDLD